MSKLLTDNEINIISKHFFRKEGIYINSYIDNEDGTYTFEYEAPGYASEFELSYKEIDSILENVL